MPAFERLVGHMRAALCLPSTGPALVIEELALAVERACAMKKRRLRGFEAQGGWDRALRHKQKRADLAARPFMVTK